MQTRQLTTGGAGIFAFFGVGPAVVDDRIYYGTQGGDAICLGADDEGLRLMGSMAVTGEALYVTPSAGQFGSGDIYQFRR